MLLVVLAVRRLWAEDGEELVVGVEKHTEELTSFLICERDVTERPSRSARRN